MIFCRGRGGKGRRRTSYAKTLLKQQGVFDEVKDDMLAERGDEMHLYDLAAKGDQQAIEAGHWSACQLDERDADGRTALMCAAIRGDHKTASLLRDLGADLDLKDRDGRKAVDLAALYGHSAVLVSLMRGGCGG